MNTRNEEKFSTERQWQEKTDAPIAVRAMTGKEINEFKVTLAQSYKCPVDEIEYYCEKIRDANDMDREDCLWLIYTLKSNIAGKIIKREVFKLKIPITEQARRDTEVARREQIRRKAKPLLIQ